MNKWVVKPLVPEEVYTDRQEFIEFFYKAALRACTRRARSTVLLGHRRMGKTEIFKRVVNRLFFEQDHTDPKAAVPVFFSFPDEIISRQDFALKYTENFVRWYVAFRLRNPKLLGQQVSRYELIEIAEQHIHSEYFHNIAIALLKNIEKGGITLPEERALQMPRMVSDWEDSTVVMFLDEFQNTNLPEFQFRVVGFMQEAVESPTCPHFMTGSAMGMLVDILGRGALYGHFSHQQITGLTDYWGQQLVTHSASYYHVQVPELMTPVVSDRCGGNPFYLNAVIQQAADQGKDITNETELNEMLAIDISSGFIWKELHDQVSRWIMKINEYGIIKWILYLAVQEEEERINLTRIHEILQQQGRDIDMQTIKDVLIKLSLGDLIDYKSFGDWFGKVQDPILEDFLKVWGKREVLGADAREIRDDLLKHYQSLDRRFNDYKGYMAEVYLMQILWNAQDNTLPGAPFHHAEDISFPFRFSYIAQRSKMGEHKGLEVDIYAAAGREIWIAESKWWTGRKVGVKVVRHLVAQAEEVGRREKRTLHTLRVWLFAYHGVSKNAETLMRKHGVMWSTRDDLNALLEFVNLRNLPVIERDERERT